MHSGIQELRPCRSRSRSLSSIQRCRRLARIGDEGIFFPLGMQVHVYRLERELPCRFQLSRPGCVHSHCARVRLSRQANLSNIRPELTLPRA
jgi:hypothetical protein